MTYLIFLTLSVIKGVTFVMFRYINIICVCGDDLAQTVKNIIKMFNVQCNKTNKLNTVAELGSGDGVLSV